MIVMIVYSAMMLVVNTTCEACRRTRIFCMILFRASVGYFSSNWIKGILLSVASTDVRPNLVTNNKYIQFVE